MYPNENSVCGRKIIIRFKNFVKLCGSQTVIFSLVETMERESNVDFVTERSEEGLTVAYMLAHHQPESAGLVMPKQQESQTLLCIEDRNVAPWNLIDQVSKSSI